MKGGHAMLQRIFVGTYSQDIVFGTGELVPGKGVGIYALDFDPDAGTLSPAFAPVPAPNPSYLALSPDRKTLYAVAELKSYEGRDGGAAGAYAVEPDGLRFLGRQPTHGADPCHLAASPDGRTVVAANFSGGRVTVFPTAPDGSLLPALQVLDHEGGGPHPKMQTMPHPHMVRFHGGLVIVSDLGADRLVLYTQDHDGALRPAAAPYHAEAPGSGPRHFDFGPDRCYVVHELDKTVTVLGPDFQLLQTIDAVEPSQMAKSECADIHLSPDGRLLCVSSRFTDLLTLFSVGPDGLLTRLGVFPSGGEIPRSFTFDRTGRWLLCANQKSDRLAVFSVEPDALTLKTLYPLPTPACLLPA